ncbi:MAG: flagellar hook assembly protein FlgD [Nitrospinales bacterium]
MITGLPPLPTDKNSLAPVGTQKSLGKDDFLKLMIAQLQAQDPTNPLDAQNFSAQLAQFSSLEQQLAMNKILEEISNNQATLNNSSMINLIGKSVNSTGNTIEFSPGKSQTLSYQLPADATTVTVDIFDSAGNKVVSLNPGAQSAGGNTIQWAGLDDKGKTVPAGTYTFKVTAKDASGNELDATTFTSGKVSEIVFENGVTYAIVNGNKIPASEISRVGVN